MRKGNIVKTYELVTKNPKWALLRQPTIIFRGFRTNFLTKKCHSTILNLFLIAANGLTQFYIVYHFATSIAHYHKKYYSMLYFRSIFPFFPQNRKCGQTGSKNCFEVYLREMLFKMWVLFLTFSPTQERCATGQKDENSRMN